MCEEPRHYLSFQRRVGQRRGLKQGIENLEEGRFWD